MLTNLITGSAIQKAYFDRFIHHFYPKMESVSKNTIFGLKTIVKSGPEKLFLKFPHAGDYIFFLTS